MFKIYLAYAIRNILRTPLRTFFTLLSVSLVICLYSVLNTVANSFVNQFKSIANKQNIDVVVQSKYSASPISSSISLSLVDKIVSDELVSTYDTVVIGRKKIRKNIKIFLIGTSNFEQSSDKFNIAITKGQKYSNDKNEMIMASQLAKALNVKIGEDLELSDNHKYKIVGFYESWINLFNTSIMMPDKSLQTLLKRKNRVNMLLISLKNHNDVDIFVKKINKNFPKIKAVISSKFTNNFGFVNTMIDILAIISFTALIIATAIILNSFIIAVGERSKEIGILRSVGWSKKMIFYMFMVESSIVSFVGGIIGFLSSFPIIYFIRENYYSVRLYLAGSFDLDVLLQVIFISIFVGIFSVILPVYYATKIKISKALKDE